MTVELVTGVKIVAKLVGAGVSAYRAARGHGRADELERDLKVVQDFVELGAQIAAGTAPRAPARIRARHVALVASAFGQAWLEQYGPRLAFERRASLEAHREAAVRWAVTELPRVGRAAPAEAIDLLDRLLAGVVETPYYAALWGAFTRRGLPDLEHDWPEPLIDVVDGDDKRRFETGVRRAYAELVTSAAGAELRAYLLELAVDRGRLVRELLVHELSTWETRHVFGNVVAHSRLPDMPLAEMYVEPFAIRSDAGAGDAELPVTRAIDALLEASPIVVVAGHFGHGKSLTARTMAWRLARAYLDDTTTPGPERSLPVFIKCVEDLTGGEARLPRMVERALWRQAGLGFQLGLKDTDPAFLAPPDTQRALFLIDGLDEFAFTPAAAVQLFEHLRGQATRRHRIVVFSRPEALPMNRLRELAIPVLELQSFSTSGDAGGQVGAWLHNWNRRGDGRPAIAVGELVARGLLELAQTPILLFMIAQTWRPVVEASAAVRRAELYEEFLRQVAHGKHDADLDRHARIARAAEHLQTRLIELGRIAPDATLDQAMLWALSRIAWESHCLEQQEKPLTQRKVVDLLSKELGMDDDAEPAHHALCDGVLLALQADFAPGSSRILFGHRSFREFLVARYWERTLWRVVRSDSAEWRTLESHLLGGRLLGLEDRSFAFLLELIERWSAPERGVVRRWAEQLFNDERISQHDEMSGAIFHRDRRAYLREAALAIGSCVAGSAGLEARSPTVLRSLLAWFWVQGKQAILRAPGLIHPGAQLREVQIAHADLQGALLEDADLSAAELFHVRLDGARLSRAQLRGASLGGSSLAGARLDGALLPGASLVDLDLSKADFTGATMTRISMVNCAVDETDFSGADLSYSAMHLAHARQVAILTGSQTRMINEILYGQTTVRPRLIADVLEAISEAGVGPLSWWTSEPDDFYHDVEIDGGDRAGAGPPRPADTKIGFRVAVPADLVDAVIARVAAVPGVVTISRAVVYRRR